MKDWGVFDRVNNIWLGEPTTESNARFLASSYNISYKTIYYQARKR